MASTSRLLGDAPDRSYATKLELFGRFVTPDLRRIFADLKLPAAGAALDLGCGPGLMTELLASRWGRARRLSAWTFRFRIFAPRAVTGRCGWCRATR